MQQATNMIVSKKFSTTVRNVGYQVRVSVPDIDTEMINEVQMSKTSSRENKI